ncbi:MAG: UDP-N-acetylmuramate--alanine ligase [Kiritimatiellae bacterium]|nr:UDP-N-acetylmuramate--alanine ligase [Kiritimatiellia bacterium]
MNPEPSTIPGHYHLVGVAGAGMSGLAQVLLAQNCDVSGSDRYANMGLELDVLALLRKAGLRLAPQDGSAVRPATAAVVASSAVEPDNPDLAAAVRHAVPVVGRGAMLARLAAGKTVVAVAGTSGKTTVTGMLGWILECANRDPTVVNGGAVLNWANGERPGNVRIGRSPLWILELDESDRSLLQFAPDWAAITNMSSDHFDLAETHELFRAFAARVRREVVGPLDPRELAESLRHEDTAAGSRFMHGGVGFTLALPGRHNAENAVLAATVCERLGIDLPRAAEALSQFRGIQRRLERVGSAGEIEVVDDYAHNPAKIRASWLAVVPRRRRVIGVWRPHGFAPLAHMLDELANAFAELCRGEHSLYILPVYYVGGTVERQVTAQTLVAHLGRRNVAAKHAENYEQLARQLLAEARAGDTILIMGARDPELPRFARQLLHRLQENQGASR